jgi:hypothetical protein
VKNREFVTILDVLDNALGELSANRVAALGTAELADLADAVNRRFTKRLELGSLL